MNIAKFLQDREVEFDAIPHRETYDAQRMAESLNVSGREVAKTVLLRADHGYLYIVAVLPANKTVDFERVSQTLGGSHIELATELEIKERCPDCEIRALPPFGSQYGMKTLVDRSLTDDEDVFFEGNTHDESIRMKIADLCRIEQPLVTSFVTEHQLQ